MQLIERKCVAVWGQNWRSNLGIETVNHLEWREKVTCFCFALICFFNLKFHFQAPNPCHLMLNLNLFVDSGMSFVSSNSSYSPMLMWPSTHYEYIVCKHLLQQCFFFFNQLQVFTMPEFLQKRFQSQWIRTYLTVVALFSYVFTKFSVSTPWSELLQY